VLATSREKFAAAANMGVDLKAPFEDLNTAREAIRRGAFQEALGYAKRADGAVDAILDRYRKVEARLKELHRAFAEVEGFGVQADDYRRALDLAAAVQAKAGRILAERAAGQISSLRTALPHLGDESGTLKALINRADASMGAQDFEGALKAVAEGQAFVEGRV